MQLDELTNDPAENAEHPMNFLLDGDLQIGFPEEGEIREGEVVAQRTHELLVDIGAKSEGIIPADEVDQMDDETLEMLAVGNNIPVCVVNPEDRNGNLILSYFKALEEDDWKQAVLLLENQNVIKCEVIGFNRGGLLAKMGRIRGFVPASQLIARRHQPYSGGSYEERLKVYVGEELSTRVIEVDRTRNRLILSERAAMKEIRSAEREKVLSQMEEGEVMEGRVVNLVDFGAFVDIGALEGLVHLSEMSWKRINHPSDLLEIGQEVEVYVLNVDRERSRVALSLKRLQVDPWTQLEETYQEGELVEATVTKLTNYGAFARVNDDYALEGLIHISEMSPDRIEHPREIVTKGDVIAARIIKLDSNQRQMGLSIKQVASDEYVEADLAMVESSEQE